MAGLVGNAMQSSQAAPQPAGTQAVPQGQAAPSQIPQGVEQPGSKLKDQTLNQIETGVEAKIPQQYQKMYQSIIVSAMDLAFNQKTHGQMMKGLQSSPDIYKNVSLICAGMLGTIYEQVKPDPNQFLPAAVPASINLMCQLLDFAQQAGMVKITPDQVAKCTNDTAQAVLRKFGVDGAKVRQAVDSNAQGQDTAVPADQAQAAPAGAQAPIQGA